MDICHPAQHGTPFLFSEFNMARNLTWGELQEFAARHGLGKDTIIVVPASDHNYRSPRPAMADARLYPDGSITEDWPAGDDDEGKQIKALFIA